jgi:hypothetical protein
MNYDRFTEAGAAETLFYVHFGLFLFLLFSPVSFDQAKGRTAEPILLGDSSNNVFLHKQCFSGIT